MGRIGWIWWMGFCGLRGGRRGLLRFFFRGGLGWEVCVGILLEGEEVTVALPFLLFLFFPL